jgi:hypothetical protein
MAKTLRQALHEQRQSREERTQAMVGFLLAMRAFSARIASTRPNLRYWTYVRHST